MSAKPIYQHFIEMAKKLCPRYITMIIPSRWFSGGKGLDSFRDEMLNDSRIRVLCDYENFKDVFPGVDLAGGACYFLWDRDNKGICKVRNYIGKEFSESYRYLNQFDTFIRSNISIEIVEKITSKYEKFLNERVSIRLPFGIPTTYQPLSSGVPCYFTQKIGLKYVDKNDVKDVLNVIEKWKFIVQKAPIAGQTDFSKPVGFYYDGNTRIAKPGEICSESWLIAGAFDSEQETLCFKSYILTKTVRFLLLQTVVSQNITRKNFCFIPELKNYTQIYSDAYLLRREEYEALYSKQQATMTDFESILIPEKYRAGKENVDSEMAKTEIAVTDAVSVSDTMPVEDDSAEKELEEMLAKVKVSIMVTHKKFGDGIITWIDNAKKYLRVKFSVGEKNFVFPDAFLMKFLKVK